MMGESKKNVPKRRFKEFENAEAWEQHKLDDIVLKIGDGLHGTPQYSENGNVYFINGNNLIDGKIIITDDTKRVTEKEQSFDDMELNKNTILMSINGTIGNLALYNGEKLMLGKSASYITSDKSDRNFLFYALQTKGVKNYFFNSLTGTTIKNLGLKTIRDTKIFTPNLQEQEKIGAAFSYIDNLITIHQRKLEKMKLLKKAYLTEMFPAEGERKPKLRFAGFTDDWKQRKLGDLADRYDNLRVPITTSDRVAGNTPYYGANGIQDYVEGFTHEGEYILVAEDGANDLKNYPVQYVKGRIWVNNHAHVLQAKQNIADNKFLKYAISRSNIEPFLVGGGRAKLNSNIMMKICIQVPQNVLEQAQMGIFFQHLDNLITLHQCKLEKLQNIKKAYLNEMFI